MNKKARIIELDYLKGIGIFFSGIRTHYFTSECVIYKVCNFG